MDVDTYLRQVKLENDSIPEVVIADIPDNDPNSLNGENGAAEGSKVSKQFERLIHIQEEYQKLDTGFKLKEDELDYFRLLKGNVASMYGIQNNRLKSSIWKYATKLLDGSVSSTKDVEPVWTNMLNSKPPSIIVLCKDGINYACTEECLHTLADLICNSPDELHAMHENVSYDLQRIRRSLLRRCFAIHSSCSDSGHTTESGEHVGLADELSQLRLLSSIISTHFNQR